MYLEYDDADPESFTFGAWLSRQRGRRDNVGHFANTCGPDGMWTGPMVEEPLGHHQGRQEWARWYAETYPSSSAGRVASERLRVIESGRRLDPAAGELPPAESVDVAELLAGAIDDVGVLLEEFVRYLAPERQERLRPELRRLEERARHLRRVGIHRGTELLDSDATTARSG